MSPIADSRAAVSPLLTTALLLASRSHLRRLGLPHLSVDQILAATGASRSRAYELKATLMDLLPTLERPAGRPRRDPPTPQAPPTITGQVLSFVMDHPGCVHQRACRQGYSDGFRAFILELYAINHQMSLEAFAQAANVPLGTLKDWLNGKQTHTDLHETQATATKTDLATTGQIQTLIEQWRSWKGSFGAFCNHIKFNLRIPFGRNLIASILEQCGERTPRRRQGRSPDEKALRQAFETFFPGAQWQGDGTPIVVQIGHERFRFNLELIVDAHSDAAVGISLRDEEDAAAVTEAFDDGVNTTGAPPICTLLDNRLSNHTAEVKEHLQPSMCMYATKGRAQNKAHVEGSFGLFAQVVPLLVISATSSKEVARQLLRLVAVTFFRASNHRPRKDRKGRSRIDIYTAETPTPEEIEQAKAALEKRLKQQELARQTLQARQDPVVRAVLDDAFDRLALEDPKGNIRAAIARYPLDAVVNGIATFEGKRHAGTLPPGVDGRYLLGIVRNISHQNEGRHITEALLAARLDAQDRLLKPLQLEYGLLQNLNAEPEALLSVLINQAVEAARQIDRLFWLTAIADFLRDHPPTQHQKLLRFCSRRIHAAFSLPYKDRLGAFRFIASKVIPLG